MTGGKIKVAILGASGMLGSMTRRVLASHPQYHLTCPSRQFLDLGQVTLPLLQNLLAQHDWVVNCAGIVKPRIDEADRRSVEQAMRVNAFLPHLLAEAAESALVGGRCRILQIATDCVYSGQAGGAAGSPPYSESSPHDATDTYGRTKSLGEVRSPLVHHLRCSIIGPEQRRPTRSLLEWFLGQPQGAEVSGYVNHFWNGVTTLAFARVVAGVILAASEDRGFWEGLPSVQHVVPQNDVNKFLLLRLFASSYQRGDAQIAATVAGMWVDRTLATQHPLVNATLWQVAGYAAVPTIQQMVEEMAQAARTAREVSA